MSRRENGHRPSAFGHRLSAIGCQRRGFTVTETLVALAVLTVALVLVAQFGMWGLQERGRAAAHRAAQESATNLLESARALPWDELTPAWAEAQELPTSLAEQLPEGKLTVRVAPEADRPRVKRVTVTITWEVGPSIPERSVELVGLFAARSAEAKGEE